MKEWTRVAALDEIPSLGARVVKRTDGDIAVFRNSENEVFALRDKCPHKGGPLSQGIVFGTSVACPLHNWTIGLDDGKARAPDEGCTQRFSCRVHDGQVMLDPVELATLALDATPPQAGPCASHGAPGDATFEVQAPHGQ